MPMRREQRRLTNDGATRRQPLAGAVMRSFDEPGGMREVDWRNTEWTQRWDDAQVDGFLIGGDIHGQALVDGKGQGVYRHRQRPLGASGSAHG
ncbi:hypothetical protein NIIDMKKI_80190 [Mycobacterium kansasii]|uniref:Uncharacterized protein n=1 Tax=Mycobacterium kansasii TaxID=1768 RepID=A0A7G1ISX8_MYCKA|nr:hypothetical protein NIIDMKKI_80190 [Mycobacterium kansasii]